MSVPAWPMPIHQTKLVMSNAQPTGMLLPQMPMPFVTSTVSEISSRPVNINAVPKPRYQPIGVLRVSTIALILSVTVLNVCPGAITGGLPAPTAPGWGSPHGNHGSRPPYSPSSGLTFRTAAR